MGGVQGPHRAGRPRPLRAAAEFRRRAGRGRRAPGRAPQSGGLGGERARRQPLRLALRRQEGDVRGSAGRGADGGLVGGGLPRCRVCPAPAPPTPPDGGRLPPRRPRGRSARAVHRPSGLPWRHPDPRSFGRLRRDPAPDSPEAHRPGQIRGARRVPPAAALAPKIWPGLASLGAALLHALCGCRAHPGPGLADAAGRPRLPGALGLGRRVVLPRPRRAGARRGVGGAARGGGGRGLGAGHGVAGGPAERGGGPGARGRGGGAGSSPGGALHVLGAGLAAQGGDREERLLQQAPDGGGRGGCAPRRARPGARGRGAAARRRGAVPDAPRQPRHRGAAGLARAGRAEAGLRTPAPRSPAHLRREAPAGAHEGLSRGRGVPALLLPEAGAVLPALGAAGPLERRVFVRPRLAWRLRLRPPDATADALPPLRDRQRALGHACAGLAAEGARGVQPAAATGAPPEREGRRRRRLRWRRDCGDPAPLPGSGGVRQGQHAPAGAAEGPAGSGRHERHGWRQPGPSFWPSSAGTTTRGNCSASASCSNSAVGEVCKASSAAQPLGRECPRWRVGICHALPDAPTARQGFAASGRTGGCR
mmetsp:Transcript_105082/g.334598  ORF Transcript_105082/g.334598 Transcript_105082/m.334598 type:complete len:592 (-) Transcript_105082:246-2021(-)